jgi:2-keto-4-pentenoate hydratase
VPLISTDATRAAARRLVDAASTRTACAPVRDLIGWGSVADAYAVQRLVIEARERSGSRVVGRTVALTSAREQREMEVLQPVSGVLFHDARRRSGSIIDLDTLIHPRVEAKVAFVLGDDLDRGHVDRERVRASVEHAAVAMEIGDSRIAGRDLSLVDLVADNVGAGLFVLGDDHVALDAAAPRLTAMTMSVDGRGVVRAEGGDDVGGPLDALVWLAQDARESGRPLAAGDIVLSGRLGEPVDARPGSTVKVEIPGVGSVTTSFAPAAGSPRGEQRS